MRSARFVSLLVLITLAKSATAQQVTPSAPQATALLQQSSTALSGSQLLNDITMHGTATYSGGPTPESDSVTLIAIGNQQSQFLATTPSGSISEVRAVAAGIPSGSGSGPGGASYKIADRDLMNSAATTPNYATAYVGSEVRNGASVERIRIWQQQNGASADEAAALQQLS